MPVLTIPKRAVAAMRVILFWGDKLLRESSIIFFFHEGKTHD